MQGSVVGNPPACHHPVNRCAACGGQLVTQYYRAEAQWHQDRQCLQCGREAGVTLRVAGLAEQRASRRPPRDAYTRPPRFTGGEVTAIRARLAAGVAQRDVAREFHCALGTVNLLALEADRGMWSAGE